MTNTEDQHRPVLREEVLQTFRMVESGIIVDATLGLGGHAGALLAEHPDVQLVGIDQDPEALAIAKNGLAKFAQRTRIVHANFADLRSVMSMAGKDVVNGILADLGVSSLHLDSGQRGFSFRFDAPLDMRMDPSRGGETAADVLGSRTEVEIADILYRFGEERASRKIARWIVQRRNEGRPVTTTGSLASLVKAALGTKRGEKHPATRTFQALRIFVNRELESLETFLAESVEILAPGGILCIISFHSIEDRMIKRHFQTLAGKCKCPPRIPKCVCGAAERKLELLTRKPIVPGKNELVENPRARSAKLRAARKL